MRTLQRPFLQMHGKSGTSFGGNQTWFLHKFLRKVGCGVISASNVLLYLQGRELMTESAYMEFAKNIWMRYLPVIPGFGMNGLTLMFGLNRYFQKNGIPYRAFWGISGRKMIDRIDKMLEKDIPVILSVGPNFPDFWGKNQLTFYARTDDKKYIPAAKTKAHYVTVTARDGIYLQISSWGKKYYIDLREYREYVKCCSNSLVSNIICIREKKAI